MNGTKESNSVAVLSVTPSPRSGCVSSSRGSDLSRVGKIVIVAGVVLSLGYAVSWLGWREKAHKKEVQDWIANRIPGPERRLTYDESPKEGGVRGSFADPLGGLMDSRLLNCVEKGRICFVSLGALPKNMNRWVAYFSYPEMKSLPSFVHCRATSFSICNHNALSVCPGLPRDLEDFEINDCPAMKSMDSLNSCEKLRRVILKGCSSISTVTLRSQVLENVSIKQWKGLKEIELTVSEGSRISLSMFGNNQSSVVSIVGRKPTLVREWGKDPLAWPVIRISGDAHITNFKLNGTSSPELFEEWNDMFALP